MLSIIRKPLSSILILATMLAVNLSFQSFAVNAMPLNQAEIDEKIQTVPEWQQENQTITRTFKFKDFVEAIAFVNKLVEPAEAAAHHPDLTISYNTVIISLTSHDAGGLTQKDFDLAQTISQIAE